MTNRSALFLQWLALCAVSAPGILGAQATTTKAAPLEGVPGAVVLRQNAGWCWYQDPRAIITRDGTLIFNTVAGDTYADSQAGDLWAGAWTPGSDTVRHFELHDKFQRDDHDVAALYEREDGRILAVYAKHGSDRLQRWRITEKAGDISAWSKEATMDIGSGNTYSNVYALSSKKGRLFNFHRGLGRNPNCTLSDDGGLTWRYGWRLLSWKKSDLKKNPGYTGTDGLRPYLRYASNGKDTIHFTTTEDHPRAFDNSVYHGYFRAGAIHASDGTVLGTVQEGQKESEVSPTDCTLIYQGDADHVAWTTDLELDPATGYPVTIFTEQRGAGKWRGKRALPEDGQDHRFHYAAWDGKKWHEHEIAYAGSRLYPKEDDYTGLAAIDPLDPNFVVISTNADPVTGKPLISKSDRKRHHELYQGRTTDGGAFWKWVALTKDSTRDHLRPNIPAGPKGQRVILFTSGELTEFTNYRLDLCAIVQRR